MSGFLKNIGKTFKKIVKSPIFKAVAIGAAIYFTGGLAMGALGGAVLPGVGTLASTLGITAGSFGTAALGTVGVAAGEAALGTGLGLLGGETAATVAAAEAGAGVLATEAAGGAALLGSAAPIAEAAGTVASAAGNVTSGLASLTDGAKSFFSSTFGQKLAGSAIEMGGKAIMGAMQSKAENDRFQQTREDVQRRGYVPDVTSQYAVPSEPARPGNIGSPVVLGGGPTSGLGGGGAGSYRPGYKTPGIVQAAIAEDPTKRLQPQGA